MRKSYLDWDKLLDNECPKCGSSLILRSSGFYSDDEPECDFSIRDYKFDQIKRDMEKTKVFNID